MPGADVQLDFIDLTIAINPSPAVKPCGIEILFDNDFVINCVHKVGFNEGFGTVYYFISYWGWKAEMPRIKLLQK
jgi:hypothetical protein